MIESSFLGLVHNAALLLAVAFIFDLAASRWRAKQAISQQVLLGLAVGTIGVVVMITPWTFTPGIVFDTRSVLIGITGLFFGPFSTVIVMAMTAAYRHHLGGAGAWTGVAVILSSGIIGIAWRHFRRRPLSETSWRELYVFGVVVHLAMLALILTLPWATAMRVLSNIALPVILIYPLGTASLGMLMVNRMRHERAVEELQVSEERFRQLSEMLPEAVFETDKDLNLTYANTRAYELFGFTAEDLAKGLNGDDMLAPEDRKGARDNLIKRLRGELEGPVEYTALRKDGSTFRAIFHANAIMKGGLFAGMEGIIIDITSRKKSEEALKTSEKRYRELFDNAIEGIAVANLETGILTDCNRSFLHLTGYDRSELIGRSQTMLHPPEEGNPPVSGTFALHASEKKGAALPDLLLTKDGTVKDVEIKSGILDVGGVKVREGFFRDVTGERRTQREKETTLTLLRLLNDQNQTRELVRAITGYLQEWTGCEAVGVRLKEGQDFPYYETRGFPSEFVEAERYLCAKSLDGQLLKDATGNPVLECMCGNILSGRFDPKFPFFTEGGSFWSNCTTDLLASTSEADRQARTRNRCNGEGYESVALIPLRYSGTVLGLLQLNSRQKGRFTPELISFLENACEQVAIALAQRQAQAALRASLLEKEVLLKEIHHRVKNNLQIISSLLNIQSHHVKDPQALEAFRESMNRVKSMAILHEKLYRSENLARIDFLEYVKSLVAGLARTVRFNTKVGFEYAIEPISLSIDVAVPCGLIVNELISNSLKHAFPGGRTGCIHIGLHKENDKFLLSLSDDGVGFPKHLDFMHTDTMGIRLVVMLVEQLRGTIELSRDGGTSFTIRFQE